MRSEEIGDRGPATGDSGSKAAPTPTSQIPTATPQSPTTAAFSSLLTPHSSPPQSFAIIPAAGRSVRMGRPKLLLPWGKHTVIEELLAAWRGSRVSQVIMTVHPDDVDLARLGASAGAEIVKVDPPPADMKASVLAGLDYVESKQRPGANAAWLLAPADMPLLTAKLIDRLLAAWQQNLFRNRQEILALSRDGRRGHPVLFPWAIVAAARRLPADAGLNQLLDDFGCRELAVDEDAAFVDLDTPADYQRWRDSPAM
ncbi:MAG TPA: nucleotidyltransferase family protein [Pirellulales bacterium]|nr:nucleotidyltransferase family protein [Pirellulales bacterium]